MFIRITGARPKGGSTSYLYVGKGADEGFLLYSTNYGGILKGKAVITKYQYLCLEDESGKLLEVDADKVNGAYSWGGGKIYCDFVRGKYIIFDGKNFVGQIPNGYSAYSNGQDKWEGDSWFECDNTLIKIDDELTFNGIGEFEGQTKKYKAVLPRWEKETGGVIPNGFLGEFVNPDGGENKYFGTPVWTDDDGNLYEKSLQKDANGHFTYGAITNVNGDWMLGDKKGSEPKLKSSVIFKNQITQQQVTISFKEWTLGSHKKKIVIGDLARWMN